ncbi:MAG: Arm DNA-binding domain-containing protein, partial [Gammaproteobacteria bacterium]|nr:Arm DNA-binding domain-containing protein [Gammaproteobacteria bacterium]
MASIKERNGAWCAEVRRKGNKPIYRSFDTKKQAELWARRIESEMDSGLYSDKTEAERTTLSTALERYRREIIPTKSCPNQENGRIDRWLKYDICYKTLSSLKGADFSKYRDERRKIGRAENTIRLELQLISHMFEIARKEWGMEYLANPLKNIRKPQGSQARTRRLEIGEYEKIHHMLSDQSNKYAVVAFELAIETSLRQGVLFQLRWEWIDLNTRMIRLPAYITNKANKGVPSVLPLSSQAVRVLQSI